MAYQLPQFDLFSIINSSGGDLRPIMWTALGVVAFFFTIYSAILLYHWFKYGLERRIMIRTLSSYFLISLILFLILAYATWHITG